MNNMLKAYAIFFIHFWMVEVECVTLEWPITLDIFGENFLYYFVYFLDDSHVYPEFPNIVKQTKTFVLASLF